MNTPNHSQEFVFSDRQPFQQCHASTLTIAGDGSILAAWFGGTSEGHSDVAIWLARRGGETSEWSTLRIVADEANVPHWNPVLFTDPSEQIHLFYKVGKPIAQWYTKAMISSDHGRTWSDSRELVPGDRGGRGPVRSRPIFLPTGEWLAPSSLENGPWRCFVDRTANCGKTWQRSADISAEEALPGEGMIQPTLWHSRGSNVHMLMRTSAGSIYRSDSDDLGHTWSPAYRTKLPNNNSGIDVVHLGDGTLLLAINPVDGNWGPRTPLVLNVSYDNGQEWELFHTLVDEPGEYSYPTIIATARQGIWVSCTWNRRKIAVWNFPDIGL